MVIVFSHVVAYNICNLINEFDKVSRNTVTVRDAEDDAISQKVVKFDDLHLFCKDAILRTASKDVACLVYLVDRTSGHLFADKEKNNRLPDSGISLHCLKSQSIETSQNLDESDPLFTILQESHKTASWKPKSVLCYPVGDKKITAKVIAVIVVASGSGDEFDVRGLHSVAKQIVACYQNLCKGDATIASEGHDSLSTPHSTLADTPSTPVREAIFALCGELYDQDAALLQVKINKFIQKHVQAECSFIMLVVPETKELFCQVIGSQVLDEEIRFPSLMKEGNPAGELSPFSSALSSVQPIRLKDVPKDKLKDLEELTGRKILSMLCVPVASRRDGSLIALACVVNKQESDRFDEKAVDIIKETFHYTSNVLISTVAYQNERQQKMQTQAMLQIARNLFTHLDDLTKLLREIMQEARNLTQAERCSVFLIDQQTDELVAKVFDGITTNENEVQSEIRMPITQGIAGHVATTGNLLNIRDAYSHPLFYRGIDDSTGFRTRNILCFPIKNENDVVLGVAQLCNKKTGPFFTTFDEDVASAFAVYCCISISHSLMYQRVIAAQIRMGLANELMMYHMKCLMYQKLQDSQHRNKLSNELMIYHMQQVSQEDVDKLQNSTIPQPSHWDKMFDLFVYPPRHIPEIDTPLTCLTMFEDLGFISKFKIRRDTLARFVLMVKRGYRNPPYHNWMHAYSVAHFCYVCIKNLDLTNCLSELELFALFVSCLCHDIDHRGTNNSYQVASKSVLAALYSSEGSVLERHHFAQSMCIINTEGCNIFENLHSKDYQKALDLMRDIILATDLAHHLRILKQLEAMAKDGYDKKNLKHRNLLLCLLMTASDLSDQTKPWDSAKHIAALIYNEFFSQGDMEKELGKEPIEMMDRERARIPDLQINFLDHIALPVYRLLSQLFVKAKDVENCVDDNRRHWEKICALIKIRRGGSCEQMSYDQILALEEEESGGSSEGSKSINHIQQNGTS